MKTLILGIGNPILCDDGVGLHIAQALEGEFTDTAVVTTTMIDLQLLEVLSDYERVFIIDALLSKGDDIGAVKKMSPEQVTAHLFSSHGLHFYELLELGRLLRFRLPEVAGVYGIVIDENCSFGTELSPEIMMKKRAIISEIARDIKNRGIENHVSCDSL